MICWSVTSTSILLPNIIRLMVILRKDNVENLLHWIIRQFYQSIMGKSKFFTVILIGMVHLQSSSFRITPSELKSISAAVADTSQDEIAGIYYDVRKQVKGNKSVLKCYKQPVIPS